MGKKNLILIVVLAALIGLAYLLRTDKGPKKEGIQPGQLLVENLDVGTLHRLQIAGPGGTNAVVKKENEWVVETLFDYPAKFATLSELTDKLIDLYASAFSMIAPLHLGVSRVEVSW